MRQTLFFIPHEIAGLPVFGAGWLLIAWAISGIAFLFWAVRRHGWNAETKGYVPFLLLVAAAIYFLLPILEVDSLGLPIRGYGMMLLTGVVVGLGLAVYRARQVGMDPDVIFSSAFWMFALGIAGARLFFVVEYWQTFQRESWTETMAEIFKFTEGGLVVYGALIGGLVGFLLFTWRHRLPRLPLADVIAPSMVIGLAIGRIGCLLNGCCYGGVCEEGAVAISFPRYSSTVQKTISPPYLNQLSLGQLHGIRLREGPQGRPVVSHVQPESAAAATGLSKGASIKSINGTPVENFEQARHVLAAAAPPELFIETDEGGFYQWSVGELPQRSLPVHPTQLYSSLNAFLLFGVLWFLFPFRRRHGVIFGCVLTIYPVTRFLLEMIRTDEAGQWGTGLTISQLVSIAMLVGMVGYWYYVLRQKPIESQTEPAS